MVSSGPAVMELANLSAKDPEETGGTPAIHMSPLYPCTVWKSFTSHAVCLIVPRLPEVLLCLSAADRETKCHCAQPTCLFCTSGQ